MQRGVIEGTIPQCPCGHLLRTEIEQSKRQCIECSIQAALEQAHAITTTGDLQADDQATSISIEIQSAETIVSTR